MYKYITSVTGNYDLLKENAKHNRRFPTEAESVLWDALKAKKLGVRFRRQHPICDYIVDFVSLSKRLVVEVDGGYHYVEKMIESDKVRTECLEKEGFRVLRFTNEHVLSDIDNVLEIIKNNL